MTLGTTTPVIEYVEDGVTLVHAIPFQFRDRAEILCWRRDQVTGGETPLVQGPGFTVAGGSGLTGSVTKLAAGVAGDTFIIKRLTARSQPTDLVQGGRFPAETLEQGLDRLTAIVQELERDFISQANLGAALLDAVQEGAGISLTLNGDGTVTLASTFDAEFIRDTIGDALRQGTGIEITVSDPSETITITNSSEVAASLSTADFLMLSGDQQGGLGGDAATAAETVRDIVALFVQAGANVTVTHNDVANTLTIASGAGGLSAEAIYDLLHASILDGLGIDRVISDAGDTITLSLDPSMVSVEEVPVLAAALKPTTTAGCGALTSAETAANKVNTEYLPFDGAAIERCQIVMPMADGWNESTIQARFRWAAPNTGTPGDVVRWGFRAVAISDDDALDSAFGAAQIVEDAITADGDLMVSGWTPATTVGGAPAEGDLAVFEFYREGNHANDTLNAIDAFLIAVELRVTRAERDDA